MQLSGFEIIAQIVNFFVLLFILQKLFYRPVRKIMAERQQKIEENITNAEKKNNEAQELIREYEKKLSGFEKEKMEKMNETRQEAAEYKRKLLEKYKKEAQDKKDGFLGEVAEEKEAFTAEVRKLMAQGTVDITEQLFKTLKLEKLEAQLFDLMMDRIRTFSAQTPGQRSGEAAGRFLLISHSQLGDAKKQQLKQVLLDNQLRVNVLEFEVDPSLVAGYVLQMPDHTIFSSIGHYLDQKEAQMAGFLEQAVKDRSEDDDAQR